MWSSSLSPSLSAVPVPREALLGDLGTPAVSALEAAGHIPAEEGAMGSNGGASIANHGGMDVDAARSPWAEAR